MARRTCSRRYSDWLDSDCANHRCRVIALIRWSVVDDGLAEVVDFPRLHLGFSAAAAGRLLKDILDLIESIHGVIKHDDYEIAIARAWDILLEIG